MDKRPGRVEALSRHGRGTVLVVAWRDRLGRDPLGLAAIEAAAKRQGTRFVPATGDGIEGETPTDVLVRRLVDAFGEYEWPIVGHRIKAALGARRTRGEKTGGKFAPLGYDDQGADW